MSTALEYSNSSVAIFRKFNNTKYENRVSDKLTYNVMNNCVRTI